MPITVRVRDVMEQSVVPIDSSRTAMDALSKMMETSVWSLIVEKRGAPVGVVTERDILRRCVSRRFDIDKTTVESIMSSPLITVDENDPIAKAMLNMIEKNVRRLYVISNGKVVGRVTQRGLLESSLNVMLALSSVPYEQ